MIYIISVEGNIGCGKDALFYFMKKYFNDNIYYISDSLYNWESETFLNDFYKNPSRWGFALEVMTTKEKINLLNNTYNLLSKNSDTDFVIITKRSPESDAECFLKSLLDMSYINKREKSIYNMLYKNSKYPSINNIVYLKSNINKCYENIITKHALLERIINFDYISKLDKNYNEWIEIKKGEECNDKIVSVIDIENFRDLEGNEKEQEELLNILLNSFPFLKKFLKVGGIYSKENKWTIVTSKKSKKRN